MAPFIILIEMDSGEVLFPWLDESEWLGFLKLLQVGYSRILCLPEKKGGVWFLDSGQCPQIVWITGGFAGALFHSSSSELFTWSACTFQQRNS